MRTTKILIYPCKNVNHFMKSFLLKLKLMIFYFILLLVSIGTWCYLARKPLVLTKGKYGIFEIIEFVFLIGVLSVGFVFIALPILTWIRKKLFSSAEFVIYHITASVILLVFGFVCMGFLEALVDRGELRPLYYFDCVTNSCIYIFCCTFFAIPIAWFYAKSKLKFTHNESIQSDLEDLGRE